MMSTYVLHPFHKQEVCEASLPYEYVCEYGELLRRQSGHMLL